jgi:hypothetical protein
MIKALTSVKNTKFLKKLRTLPNYANSLQGDYIAVQKSFCVSMPISSLTRTHVAHTEPSRAVRIPRGFTRAWRPICRHVGYWYATPPASGRHDIGLAEMDKMLQSGI